MSERVQSVLEAVLSLTVEQRKELMEALAAETSRTQVSGSRRELVESVKGKYRHVPTSSESFVIRKREDLALESSQ